DNLPQVNTHRELFYAGLFLAAGFCVLLPIMAQIELAAAVVRMPNELGWRGLLSPRLHATWWAWLAAAVVAGLLCYKLGWLTQPGNKAPRIRWLEPAPSSDHEGPEDMEWYRQPILERIAPILMILTLALFVSAIVSWSWRVAGLCGDQCAGGAIFDH